MFKVTIDEQFTLPTLIARQAWNSTELFWGYAASVSKIVFDSNINIPVGASISWDVSAAQDESIMAYLIDDGLGASTNELHFQADDNIVLANANSGHYFYGFANATTIENLNYLNTSNVTSMTYMFRQCGNLLNLDVSNFDTSIVNNMQAMFEGCSFLTNLIISNFDTSSVTIMTNMFYNCCNLTSLDLYAFDTSKVTNMSGFFRGCSGLTNTPFNQ